MAIQKITYNNKEDLNIDPTVPVINKVVAADMNEIKSVINNNADELEHLDVPPEIAVQTTEPTEDEKLWINPEDIPSGTGFELNKFYPIGSIYINTTGVNPSTFMGGTWEAFGSGKVLVGQDTNDTDFDTLLETGGSKELQAHNHTLGISTNVVGGATSYGLDGSASPQATINTSYSGTGESGNLQPYIVVSMWVRTA